MVFKNLGDTMAKAAKQSIRPVITYVNGTRRHVPETPKSKNKKLILETAAEANAPKQPSTTQYHHPYSPPKKSHVTIEPRNRHQRDLLRKLRDDLKSIVVALGPAGSGKTLIAVLHGIKLLQEKKIEKIIVTRPAVSVDEDLGFLPGTLNEKMAPWTRPIFDIFGEYYHKGEINYMLNEGIIEISPLAYMRGRTFSNAYIIADEMQLGTQNQCKMLLSRIGENSKMVITGDLAQADRGVDNGLFDFIERLTRYKSDNSDKLSHIDMVFFDHADIVRHPAVIEILDIYGENDD